MKKQITLISSLLLTCVAFSQTAITINAADMPVPTAPYNIEEITAGSPPNATLGDNQTWDYSSFVGSNPSQNTYTAETDAFFTNAGVDVYINSSKALGPSMFYDIANEIDFNANKIETKGLYVYPQAYGLGASTGNNADSLVFPVQGIILSTPRPLNVFPMTANSAWSSNVRHVVDFNLTVATYGLNHTPGQHVFYIVQTDTVVGWGKLSIHTASGSSIPYDVLMDKRTSYAIDSFYLAGNPAPAPLLTAFGVTQGQTTSANNGYNFYRQGSFNYLMRHYYGADNTFTTMQNSFINTDNILSTGLETPALYTTILYPNPTNGSQLNLQVIGKNTKFTSYSVMDMMGREVQTGMTEATRQNCVSVLLNDNLVNGKYVIRVKDSNNEEVVIEKFDLLR